MRHVSMSIFAAVLVSTATVTTASAQSHQRAAGDTLRFHQATKMSQTMASDATGEITQSMNSNARLVAAFGGGDTITAWIDSAASKASGPLGEIEPDMSTILI